MTHVLVTGASGFVAADLIPRLLRAGYSVTALSRQPVPAFADLSIRCIHGLDLDDLGGSMTAPALASWQQALTDVDVVVHLAARVHVMSDVDVDPMAANRRTNRDASVRLASLAQAAGVKRFIFMSSIKVNGEQTLPGSAFSAMSVPAPQDPYGVSKWEAEQALNELSAATGLELVVIRPALVYGPGAKGNLEVMLRIMARGWPLPLAAIKNSRSLLARSNLNDFLVRCIQHSNAIGGCFLLADCRFSTPELLRQLVIAGGRPIRLWSIPVFCLNLMAILSGRRAWIQRLCGNLEVDSEFACQRMQWRPLVQPVTELAAMINASTI